MQEQTVSQPPEFSEDEYFKEFSKDYLKVVEDQRDGESYLPQNFSELPVLQRSMLLRLEMNRLTDAESRDRIISLLDFCQLLPDNPYDNGIPISKIRDKVESFFIEYKNKRKKDPDNEYRNPETLIEGVLDLLETALIRYFQELSYNKNIKESLGQENSSKLETLVKELKKSLVSRILKEQGFDLEASQIAVDLLNEQSDVFWNVNDDLSVFIGYTFEGDKNGRRTIYLDNPSIFTRDPSITLDRKIGKNAVQDLDNSEEKKIMDSRPEIEFRQSGSSRYLDFSYINQDGISTEISLSAGYVLHNINRSQVGSLSSLVVPSEWLDELQSASKSQPRAEKDNTVRVSIANVDANDFNLLKNRVLEIIKQNTGLEPSLIEEMLTKLPTPEAYEKFETALENK